MAFDGLSGRHQLQFDTGAHRNILHGGAVRAEQMRGLFGSVLFADEFAVILDLPRRRMGIITSAALGRAATRRSPSP